jgi:protein TonB
MTGLSLPVARRRFLFMLWLSVALHALVIGLTRLPPPIAVPLPPELKVLLGPPLPPAPPAEAEAKPTPQPIRPFLPALRSRLQAQPVVEPLPQPVVQPGTQVPAASPQVALAPPLSATVAAPSRESPGPQLNIPLAVDSRYYTAKELDIQPIALHRPEPVYPVQAEEQGVAGRVVIRLHLEVDGTVSKIEVMSVAPGGGFGELFKKSTLDSVKNIRFRPALRNGQPVRAIVEIPILFEPDR